MLSREEMAKLARQQRLTDAETSLAQEREAHTWLTETGRDGAARRMQENILKIEKHIERCRKDL